MLEGRRPLAVGICWVRHLKFLSVQWVSIKGFGSEEGLLTSATAHTEQNMARKVFCVCWCVVRAVSVFMTSRDVSEMMLALSPRTSALRTPAHSPDFLSTEQSSDVDSFSCRAASTSWERQGRQGWVRH